MFIARLLFAVLGLLHAAAAYFYFSKERYALLWASAWLGFTAGAVVLLAAYPLPATGVFLSAISVWTLWWASIRALTDRDWVPEDARQATAEIAGTRLIVHNLRNFEWRSRHDFTPRWEERVYDLSALEAIDLFACTWRDPRVAHLLVSFVFATAPPLAFSIETRRETTEKWTLLAGFMKSYEIIMIAADERDVVRVRTNVRGETVRRYRILSTPDMRRQLLALYIARLNAIAARPRFYNTLFRNCTTEVLQMLRAAGRPVPFDWRLLVTGYVPEYLYRNGLIAADRPFAEVQASAEIGARARAATGDEFSACIRAQAPAGRDQPS